MTTADMMALSALIVAIGGVLTNLYAKRKDAQIARDKASIDAGVVRAQLDGQVGIKEIDVGEMVRRDLVNRVTLLEERDRECQKSIADLRVKYLRARQWIWTLTTTMRGNGITVVVPGDLELEGFPLPDIGQG